MSTSQAGSNAGRGTMGIEVLFGLLAFGTIGFLWAVLPDAEAR